MKTKAISALILLTICNISFAASTICDLKTNHENEAQSLTIQSSQAGHGPISNFETENFKGIITSSKGFLVAGITIKATNQSMSFHGKGILGGQLIDGDEWIQINCK